eukprot:TRINITY_DN9735_c0_g1_i1.p1 TRINITY_DN9735_c0_g1~~TRINITY_DN9735_c0_g1_i1.p1  ORF type:complete len:292 (-),score=64.40 TRINITY_DN9735_c0_g1_i1:148-1023(-)
MPSQYNVIATSTTKGEVHVFDYFKHPTRPDKGDVPRPELRLVGQDKEGYGLAWNSARKGVILSASTDGKICSWDIESSEVQVGRSLDPLTKYDGHTNGAEDVQWHRFHQDIFGSVGDDRKLNIWDMRDSTRKPFKSVLAHEKDVLSVDFNPFNEYLLGTSSADYSASLWDLRNMKRKVYELKEHKDEVVSISWSPFKESVLATSGNDRRIMIWDLSNIGQREGEVPSELLFVHGGHTSNVMEMSWNANEEYLIASVSFDNDIQIWQIVPFVSSVGREYIPWGKGRASENLD